MISTEITTFGVPELASFARAVGVAAFALVASTAISSDLVAPINQRSNPEVLALDTHLDTPAHFGRIGWDIAERHGWGTDLTQVDYPRMVEGGLNGGFFVIYTPQGPLTPAGYLAARDAALMRAVHIREMVAAHRAKFELACRAEDAIRIAASGKRVVFQSIENSYPLGTDLTLLETFKTLGVRMAGPVHTKTNQLADSATDQPSWNGLSPLGRAWVTEMNRLGLIIDASHASDAAFDQMLELSKSPIILSHSGSRTVFDHPRNLDDERIRKLAAAGGVIQVTTVYLAASRHSPSLDLIDKRLTNIDQLSIEEQKALIRDAHSSGYSSTPRNASFNDFFNSLQHILKLAGVDHVGIGADWDGGGGVSGLEDVASLRKVTVALRKAGYSQADISKIWSGNVLRLLRKAEDMAEVAPSIVCH